jgi:GMP synthase (glutamine-hydrolysing)
MMCGILIVKVGSTLPTLVAPRGDFEDWIRQGMGRAQARIVDVRCGRILPSPADLDGIVVSGSHHAVTEHTAWSEATAEWLAGAVMQKVPVLGICYGHQLLAYALGGEVGDNPRGLEYGTVEVHLEEQAKADALLNGLSNPAWVQVCHRQSVLRLPPGARRLASSARDENQAFVVGEKAWGVQFHPEFDAAIVRAYIHAFRTELLAQGQEPTALQAACVDTPQAAALLKRFAQMAGHRRERARS